MKKYKNRYDYHFVNPKLRVEIELLTYKSDIKESVRRVTEGRSFSYTKYKKLEDIKKRPIGYRTYPHNVTLVRKNYYSIYSDDRLTSGFFVMVGMEIAHSSYLGTYVKNYYYNKYEETGESDHSGQLFICKKVILTPSYFITDEVEDDIEC